MQKSKELRSVLLLAAVATTVLLATSCSAAPPPVATTAPDSTGTISPGKVTLLVGNLGGERFDRAFSSTGDQYARVVHGFVLSSDLKEGRQVLSPGIASKWGISKDGLTWTLTIRKGVKFHDETEVTPEDVLWALQHVMGPQAGEYTLTGLTRTLSDSMVRIAQTGPDELSVTTKTPAMDFALQVSELGQTWIGAVLPKRATLHDQKEEEAYDLKPVGAGIMKLVKHLSGDSMTFERFADYYQQPTNGFSTDKRVHFTQLDIRLVPEESTRVAALRTGEADIAPVSLATRQQVEAGGSRLVFAPEAAYLGIYTYGCWEPQFPCRDKRVRQALGYAIEKQLMRDRLYGADLMELRGWTFVTPSTIGYSPDLAPFPFDAAKARQLLADAGYPGGRGFGQLALNTWASRSLPLMPEAAQLIADSWKKELGLDVVVKLGDEEAVKASTRTGALFGQALFQDNDARIDATSTVRGRFATSTRLDRAHNDPELAALVDKALVILDPVEQERALNAAYRRLMDESYYIAIGTFSVPWGVAPRIRTWQPYPVTSFASGLHTITVG